MSTELTGPGYIVTILGRAGLTYQEGDRTVFVDGEMLTGEVDFVVYASSIVAWDGSGAPIDAAEKERILANIREAFRLDGGAVDIAT